MEYFIHEVGRRIENPKTPPEQEGSPSEEEMRRMMKIIGKYMDVLPPDKMMRKETGR